MIRHNKKHALPPPGKDSVGPGSTPHRITPEYLCRTGSEHGHQAAFFCWSVDYAKVDPRIHFMFAIANGGFRDIITATNLKAEGVKRGVLDVFLPVTCPQWAGLWVEMKKPKVGRLSLFQEEFKDFVISQNYKVVICRTWEQARDEVIRYLWNAR